MTWKGINPAIGGMTTAWNAVMQNVPSRFLCSLDGARHVSVFSDYSGMNAPGLAYMTYSFMLTDLARCRLALDTLQNVRSTHGLGPRRMSYKGLSDATKASAVPAFVAGARQLRAHVITFAVSKSIRSLFHPSRGDDRDAELSRIADKYKSSGQEHLARVLHFFSFALAGLSSPGQDIDWITDVDQIVPEQEWLADLVKLAGSLSSHYLMHSLGHLRLGTTRSDDGTRLLEDLCAVPDFFAGGIAESLSHQSVPSLNLPMGMVVPIAPTVRRKAVDVMRLLTNDGPGTLRSTCLCIEPDGVRWRIQARYFHEIPQDRGANEQKHEQ